MALNINAFLGCAVASPRVVESPALTVIVLLTWISVDDRRAVRR